MRNFLIQAAARCTITLARHHTQMQKSEREHKNKSSKFIIFTTNSLPINLLLNQLNTVNIIITFFLSKIQFNITIQSRSCSSKGLENSVPLS